MSTSRGPGNAPNFNTHRTNVTATDTIANVTARQGMNMEGYENAHVQVIPSGGANPTVQVYFWAPGAAAGAGGWIREHTAATFAGVGADTPFGFTVAARGRKMFVAVTTLAGGSVRIDVSGYPLSP